MMDHLERAAKALHAELKSLGRLDWSWDDPLCEKMRQEHMRLMRIAVAALRDPPQEIVDQVYEQGGWNCARDETSEIFNAFIDLMEE